MDSKIWRPDLKEPSIFRLQVDDHMLYFLAEGLREQMADIRREIRAHEETCGENPTACQIRYASLIAEYGSAEAAAKETGALIFDCLDDLADLYTTVGLLAKYLYKLDYIRRLPEEVGDDPDRSDWRPQRELARIQAEQAYRNDVAKDDTASINKADLDKMLEDEGSLLGLTETLPKVSKPAAKKANGK